MNKYGFCKGEKLLLFVYSSCLVSEYSDEELPSFTGFKCLEKKLLFGWVMMRWWWMMLDEDDDNE